MAAKNGRVFILGAGASHFASYPLAAGLEGFVRTNTSSANVITRQTANEVLDKLMSAEFQLRRQTRRTDKIDLELLLTHLDMWQNVGNLKLVKGEWTEVDRAKLIGGISNAFMWHQHVLLRTVWGSNPYGLNAQVDGNRVKKVAKAWADFLGPGDTLISFNWDLLHESILWAAEKWSYVDGYGFAIRNASPTERRTGVNLYKLHGSVNWMQGDETEAVPEIEFVDHFFPVSRPPEREWPAKGARMDSGRSSLILPTYLKDISRNSALLRIWRLAQEALRAATEIIVIGYSLNPADHPARLLFGTELGRDHVIQEVTVVSPSPGEWQSYLVRLGKRLNPIRKTFEDWVLGG